MRFDAIEIRSLDSEAWARGGCNEAGVEGFLWFDADEFRSLDSEAWMRDGCDEAGVGFDAIEIGGIKTSQLSQHTIITSSKLTESRPEGGGTQLELAGESAELTSSIFLSRQNLSGQFLHTLTFTCDN